MKAVIGIGNPDKKYKFTRHNIGRIIVDEFSKEYDFTYKAGRGQYYYSKGKINGEEIVLVRPTTYMNNSGIAVGEVQKFFKLLTKEILLIADEVQFILGRINLKSAGGGGGHNGIDSVIYHLNTIEFPRLRCGIGNQFKNNSMRNYVLSEFSEDEKCLVNEMVEKAIRAIYIWFTTGMDNAMNEINAIDKTKNGQDRLEIDGD